MLLSIIIVNWNTRDLLRRCLRSVFEQTKNIDFEVFVVDNASSDQSADMVRREFPQVLLIVSDINLGFGKGNNMALQYAKGEFILFLNPDTEVLDRAIEKTVRFMQGDKQIGIVGCRIVNADLSLQPSCRKFPTVISQALILLKLHNFFPQFKSLREYHMLDFDYSRISEVDQVMGAFLMIPKDVLDKVGTFDERYWILFEEVDLCKRVKSAGYKIIFYPDAQILHEKGASFKQQKALKRQLNFNSSLLKYFKKNHSFASYFVLLLLQPISLLLATTVQFLYYFNIRFNKKKYL